MSDLETYRRVRRARKDGDVDVLVATLADPVEGVLAATYLGEIGDSSAGDALRAYVADPFAGMRAAAIVSCGQLRLHDTTPEIAAIAISDTDRTVRAAGMEALGHLGGPLAESALKEGLADPGWRVRRVAAAQIGQIGQEDAIPLIEAASRSDWWPTSRPYRRAIRQIRARLK